MDINVMGTIHMIHAVSKYMADQQKGTIVNIGSICGTMANSESVGYHASKGAVEMVTKSLGQRIVRLWNQSGMRSHQAGSERRRLMIR